MPPTRSKNYESTETLSTETNVVLPSTDETCTEITPYVSPGSKILRCPKKKGFSLLQKQALIENLQLEITERVRRLRAQYVLQAQGLRTRVEIRVNRIPAAIRQLNMGDLLLRYKESSEQEKSRISAKGFSPEKKIIHRVSKLSPFPQRGVKRTSDTVSIDKENNDDFENDIKRSRIRGKSPSHIPTSQILSPRSANSRILRKPPFRPISQVKSVLVRSNSPQKSYLKTISGEPSSNLKSTSTKTEVNNYTTLVKKSHTQSSITSSRVKRIAEPSASRFGKGRASVTSQKSDSSSNTIRKTVQVTKITSKDKSSQIKRGVLGTIRGIGSQKKVSAIEKTTVASRTVNGRVLRKRK